MLAALLGDADVVHVPAFKDDAAVADERELEVDLLPGELGNVQRHGLKAAGVGIRIQERRTLPGGGHHFDTSKIEAGFGVQAVIKF